MKENFLNGGECGANPNLLYKVLSLFSNTNFEVGYSLTPHLKHGIINHTSGEICPIYFPKSPLFEAEIFQYYQ